MKKTILITLGLIAGIGLNFAQKITIKDMEAAGFSTSIIQKVYPIIDSANLQIKALNGEKEKIADIRKTQNNKIQSILTPEEFTKFLEMRKSIVEKFKQNKANTH